MTTNELKEMVREQPFQPFKIYMNDGSSFKIDHPDALLVGNYTAITSLPNGDDGDHFMHLSIKSITRVERFIAAH